MFNSVPDNVEMLSEMSYLLFISSQSLPESQELCLEITVLARIAESRDRTLRAETPSIFPDKSKETLLAGNVIKIASAVNQICRFGSTKSNRNLTVACHKHPTE